MGIIPKREVFELIATKDRFDIGVFAWFFGEQFIDVPNDFLVHPVVVTIARIIGDGKNHIGNRARINHGV